MKKNYSHKCLLGKICVLSLVIVFLTLLSPMIVNAELQFYQTKNNLGNGTISNRLSLGYEKNTMGITLSYQDVHCLIPFFCQGQVYFSASPQDYVKGNDPFETYIQYNIYVKTFNQNNPNFTIDYCSFKIQYWAKLESSPTTIFEKNYTQNDEDINKAQYFFRLYAGDQAIAEQRCYYQNKSFDELIMPMEMQMVTPTHACKKCQYYEWSKQEKDISKTKSIADHIVSVSNYIQKVILLNFEILLALFWVGLILMIFVGIGLIFLIAYWIYLYFARIMK